MFTPSFAKRRGVQALVVAWLSATSASAAISFADITQWVGAAEAPDVSSSALVIDWQDGQRPLIVGFRWSQTTSATGRDLQEAVIGAGLGLMADNTTFVSTFTLGARSQTYSDNGTAADYFDDRYWNYWTASANPYTGSWTESQVGAAGRTLTAGSWDGWAYGVYGTLPVSSIPEPGIAGLFAGMALLWGRRQRSSGSAAA